MQTLTKQQPRVLVKTTESALPTTGVARFPLMEGKRNAGRRKRQRRRSARRDTCLHAGAEPNSQPTAVAEGMDRGLHRSAQTKLDLRRLWDPRPSRSRRNAACLHPRRRRSQISRKPRILISAHLNRCQRPAARNRSLLYIARHTLVVLCRGLRKSFRLCLDRRGGEQRKCNVARRSTTPRPFVLVHRRIPLRRRLVHHHTHSRPTHMLRVRRNNRILRVITHQRLVSHIRSLVV